MGFSDWLSGWFAVRKELPRNRIRIIGVFSFLLPLLVWCAISYVPFIWHPMVMIKTPGDVDYFQVDMLIDKATFSSELANMQNTGK